MVRGSYVAMSPHLLSRLASALRGLPELSGFERLEPLADTGLAHWHVRLVGTGLLARVPKQSQMNWTAADNLRYQAACFRRAEPSGHTPRLHAVLPPSADLDQGALLVEEVQGRPARLAPSGGEGDHPRALAAGKPAHPRADDLVALAHALAALHRLPLPTECAPLHAPADPLAELASEIDAQAQHLPRAGLEVASLEAIEAERQALRATLGEASRPSVCLIAFDAHPGNFLVRADGRAMLVDLEKCRYGAPGLDLAHASLYTSTTWDVRSRAVLNPARVADFYKAWAAAVGPERARLARPWHLPLRRAMWLWSITWCAEWRVASSRPPRASGRDWSAQRSEPALVAHVRERVDHYLSADCIARVRDEFDALQRALAPSDWPLA